MAPGNPGLLRLKELGKFRVCIEQLTPATKLKIKDTVAYTMSREPGQNETDAWRRCAVAIMAEQKVAQWLRGSLTNGNEDFDDPLTWAYDVLSHVDYTGIRVEVKTHQSDSRWIAVTTGYSGDFPGGSGINLGPFLQHQIADCIIILDSEKVGAGEWEYTPRFIGDHDELKSIVKKSNYDGWYLNIRK